MMKEEDTILKYLNNELNEEELNDFKKTDDYGLLHRIDKHLENLEIPPFDVETKLEEVTEKISVKPALFQLKWYHIAASILIIGFSFIYIFYNPTTLYETGKGQQLSFYLPDSSFVVLKADSKLSFKTNKWENNRNLELQGEAYFEVKKGSKFSVSSQNGLVSVLGTKFNINDRGQYYLVDCYEGKVSVATSDLLEELTALHSLRILDNKMERFSLNNKIPQPNSNTSNFENLPLGIILTEMERQFAIQIEVENIDLSTRMTLSYKNDNIEGALNLVSKPLNSTFKKISSTKYKLTVEK